MQGRKSPYLLLDEQLTIRQDTDTATPRSVVPIYLIHDGNIPFCSNPVCFCQSGKRAATALFQHIAAGHLELAQLVAGTEECYLYGHTWRQADENGVKECQLCGIKGYCPGCTLIAPANARPFYCTSHAERQVQ